MTINDYLKDKKILVFGIGRQGGGLGDANYLANNGYQVRATDMLTRDELSHSDSDYAPNLELSLGGHLESDIDWCDLVLKNPGVPDDHPLILRAKSKGVAVVTSIALFTKYSPIKTIGITGTRGKTTTTTLIYNILNAAYPNQVLLGGNLPGHSGLSLFEECDNKRYAILELSSFQLHSFHDLRVSPTYSVVTNLYPDHLNRYPDMDSYRHDKEAIVLYQASPGFTVYNSENEGSVQIADISPVTKYPYHSQLAHNYQNQLLGDHNQSNISAAITLSKELGVPDTVIRQAISQFAGVSYRLETIRTIDGVTYINDTTATTPTAALAAIRAITGKIILICGGESKKLPHNELIDQITLNDQVKKVIFLGSQNIPEFTEAIYSKAAHKVGGRAMSMADAVSQARSLAQPGDSVLLSPGFASFDLFKNEFDRGNQFNQVVKAL